MAFASGRRITLARLGPGSVFGELALFDAKPLVSLTMDVIRHVLRAKHNRPPATREGS